MLPGQGKTCLQMVKFARGTLRLQRHGAGDEDKGHQSLQETTKKVGDVRCHNENPISFVDTKLTIDPVRAGTISLKETRPSTGTPV
jgi:hypothetical protein